MADHPTIIIKRKKRRGAGDDHHGGQWKVAYADFMTAMMALFLIMWLLNAVTEEQMVGIANYFSPSAASNSQSGAGGVLGGMSMIKPGALRRSMSAAGVTISQLPLSPDEVPDGEGMPAEQPTQESAQDVLENLEQEEFEKAEAALRAAIEASPDLREFSENLLIDMTPEGMRIQIVDADGRSMFPLGSSVMYTHTVRLLEQIVQAIGELPNEIAVIGHTDATPYQRGLGYTNWELSSDRANASRRSLVTAGLARERIVRVTGRADHEPLVEDDPFSPQNRRISVLLLRESAKPQGS
ncbi:MAG: flagellar motor protein MotB [Proteobacteria bacterium]|nr:flagellar motor protein MotB [Pseudomonadota bacterium]